jgi:hypothetical protein
MKTNVLFIACLFVAGIMLTSFQKDKGLLEANASTKQSEAVLVADHSTVAPVKKMDVLTNYPDPFEHKTLIEYKVLRPGWVTLIVMNRQEQFAIRLVSEFKYEGVYRIEFDARELPPGQYIAELRTGFFVARENMTKIMETSTGDIPKKYK